MGWKIVEVNIGEYLQLYLNNILIKREQGNIIINISDIDVLIIHNVRSSISIQLLNELSSNNVNVIFMNSNHEPECFLIPVCGNHISLEIFKNQLLWTNIYKAQIWTQIIKNKLTNQQKTLVKIFDNEPSKQENIEYLLNIVNDVKEFDITNREGHGAKVYWHTLFDLNFIRDYNCISNPVINGMLNYGYAILRSTVIQAIFKKGLDPRISFFHKTATNFFALASDIMEPFRPLVDNIVYKYKEAKIFSTEIRDELIGILEKQVTISGNKHYLPAACCLVVDNLISGNGWIWVSLWD